MSLLSILTLVFLQDGPDPLLLDVAGPGRMEVSRGLWNTQSEKSATIQDIARSAEGLKFVFVGESHDQAAHHVLQAEIIQTLVDRGRNVVVGFEMFTRDNQNNLAPWTVGYWNKENFIEQANWKSQWGFDYALYEPIFETVKKNRLPMVALNLPRDWVRQIGRQGVSAIQPEQRKWIPDLFLDDIQHKEVFQAMTGGHPMSGDQANNMYAAMVAWDEGMANTAIETMSTKIDRSAIMVVVAGSGHMMYGLGINHRISRRTGQKSLNVLCTTTDGTRQISRKIADFVFVSDPKSGG